MTSAQIEGRPRTGRWERVARGVYRHAATEQTRLSRLLTVCLAHNALASHRSAAAVHSIDGYSLDRIEVVVAANRSPAVKGATLHKSAQMDLARPTVRKAIPVTGVGRTVLDVAAVVSRRPLDDTIDAVLRDGRLRLWDLYDVLVSHARRGRNGCGALRAALDARLGGDRVSLSRWSRMVSDLLATPASSIQYTPPTASSSLGSIWPTRIANSPSSSTAFAGITTFTTSATTASAATGCCSQDGTCSTSLGRTTPAVPISFVPPWPQPERRLNRLVRNQ